MSVADEAKRASPLGSVADPKSMSGVSISVLLPAYDEAANLARVIPRTFLVLSELGSPHEVVVIDDGSQDDTQDVINELREQYPTLRCLRFSRNVGKSAALQAGFDHTDGDVVVLMDADGQDEPNEIPKLLEALSAGLDLVTGYRAVRHDRFVKRTTSRLFNWVSGLVTGSHKRDLNSGFKAMRRPVAEVIELYGELHRYIPVLADWAGFRTGEIPVQHHPRFSGKSKFGRSRFWRGFLDLLTVKFLTTYTSRPFHLFGGIGFALGFVGAILLTWMLIVKLSGNPVGHRPALLVGIFLVIVSVQMLSLGLLGELLVYLFRKRRTDTFVTEM